MTNENDEIRMSQLADGELASDQANDLLLDVLDAPAQREKLKTMLRLRRAMVGWRTQQPQRTVVVVSQQRHLHRRWRITRRLSNLAVAACVGGLLVLTGIWASGWLGSPIRSEHQWQITPGPDALSAAAQVSPGQMQQVAKVFALHESVAGPLAWYAADDQNVRLASARGAEAGQAPIGVLLRLDGAANGSGARTLVIVCRNDEPAVIELPAESAGRPALRVYLTPRTVNGKVDVRYAIAVDDSATNSPDGQSQQAPLASLSGQRNLGLAESPLGQLAVGDKLLNVEAAAWPMRQEHRQ